MQNFSANAYRRVDLTVQLPPMLDVERTIARLRKALASVPHVLAAPEPNVEILTVSPAGSVLAVRPFCHNDHYWHVYFETNRLIDRTLRPEASVSRVG